MRAYLVQHGEAETEEQNPDRPLTDRGIEDVERVAGRAVGELDLRVARVFHSGKTRARQTAEIWGEMLDLQVEQADGLAPNDDPADWVERLERGSDNVLLVGHLPHLDRLSASLLTGGGDGVIRFLMGGVIGLERAEDGWKVALVLPPALR